MDLARSLSATPGAREGAHGEDGALMATYATAAQLADYVLDNEDVSAPQGDAAERLLRRAERDVDRVVGPWPILSTGLRFDPGMLPVTAREALARATCAAAEFRLLVGESELVGDADYVPEQVRLLRAAPRIAPKILEELAGHGLIVTSYTVAPDPLDAA